MSTSKGRAAKEQVDMERLTEQLRLWKTQLDNLIAGSVSAGAQSHDAYRIRINELRTRHGSLQTKLNDFKQRASQEEGWVSFRMGIRDDWRWLSQGFDNLAQ